jgi:hypothetical protein
MLMNVLMLRFHSCDTNKRTKTQKLRSQQEIFKYCLLFQEETLALKRKAVKRLSTMVSSTPQDKEALRKKRRGLNQEALHFGTGQ